MHALHNGSSGRAALLLLITMVSLTPFPAEQTCLQPMYWNTARTDRTPYGDEATTTDKAQTEMQTTHQLQTHIPTNTRTNRSTVDCIVALHVFTIVFIKT